MTRLPGRLCLGVLLIGLIGGCDEAPREEASGVPLLAGSATPEPTPQPPFEAAASAPGFDSEIPPANADAVTPRSFVHYKPWFHGAPDYAHWQTSAAALQEPQTPFKPASARRPAIGPYDSRDPAVIGYHLLLMKAAGFSGAIVAWPGADDPAEAGVRALFDTTRAWAMRYDFRFSLMLMHDAKSYQGIEPQRRAALLNDELTALLAAYGTNPVYQRLEGEPVLFSYPQPDPLRPGETTLPPETWRVARGGAAEGCLLGVLAPGPVWRNTADLAYGWIPLGLSPTDPGDTYLSWLYGSYAAQEAQGWKLPVRVGIVYPGLDDRSGRDPARRPQMDRTIRGKATLSWGWEALNSHNRTHPEAPVRWSQTVSFNDWLAGHEIEPSEERGSVDLELAARWNQRFTGASETPPEAWRYAQAYLDARRRGKTDDQLADSLEQFAAGEYLEALKAALP